MFLFLRKHKPDIPDFWHQYQKINHGSVLSKMPLNKLVFTAIDIESTGLNIKKDKLIAFAGIKIQELTILVAESIELIINYDTPIQDNAVHIHEIVEHEKQRGISEYDAIRQIIQFISNSILVGYHIQFDYQMINQILKKLIGHKLLNRYINIIDLINRIEDPVHKIYPASQIGLKQQCEKYGINLEDQHTAAGDAFATSQLFLKIINKLNRRGIKTWGELKQKVRY